MLGSVDSNGSLFDDACADAVRALDLLGPYPAEPRTPIFESGCLRTLTAMIDCDTRTVAEQDRISSLPNHPVQLVDLLLGAEDELVERLPKRFQLTSRGDVW